jgi:hypothetical protein
LFIFSYSREEADWNQPDIIPPLTPLKIDDVSLFVWVKNESSSDLKSKKATPPATNLQPGPTKKFQPTKEILDVQWFSLLKDPPKDSTRVTLHAWSKLRNECITKHDRKEQSAK